MDEQAERDRLIELGFRWEDFFTSSSGKFFIDRLQQKIGMTLHDMTFKREKIDAKNYDFTCLELSHFERHRGFALGVQWVMDEITSAINFAKRAEKEKKEQEEQNKVK